MISCLRIIDTNSKSVKRIALEKHWSYEQLTGKQSLFGFFFSNLHPIRDHVYKSQQILLYVKDISFSCTSQDLKNRFVVSDKSWRTRSASLPQVRDKHTDTYNRAKTWLRSLFQQVK